MPKILSFRTVWGECEYEIRNEMYYRTISAVNNENGYPVMLCCSIMHVSISAYYKWKSDKKSPRRQANEKIMKYVEKIHMEHPEMGYRRIRDELERIYEIHANDKRILRICRILGIKSTIKYTNNGCTRHAYAPQYTAENILNRNFHADRPNEKWVTDVTEFRYYIGPQEHKLYLSAIKDLADNRIVSYEVSDHNDNSLVFKTFDAAIKTEPFAHPLFHSDRGFQYTNRIFHKKLSAAGMTQSMSRVGHCLDNGAMESFCSVLKREKYYGRKFHSRDSLVSMIKDYIEYYNNERIQRCLGVLTPIEKHNLFFVA